MARTPICSKEGLKRGFWTREEDILLVDYIQKNGEGKWKYIPKNAGLLRCGKSCRLRWLNYLRPSIKRGDISPDEEDLIIRLHALLGNRWSLIAKRLPGRTDNEIKNHCNTLLGKKKIGNVNNIAQTKCKNEGFSTKLYFPKATRFLPVSVAPRNCSFNNSMTVGDEIAPQDGDDVINGKENVLETMFDGNEQHLTLDSFDDSIFDIQLDSFFDFIFT